jgi:hypothetical protein
MESRCSFSALNGAVPAFRDREKKAATAVLIGAHTGRWRIMVSRPKPCLPLLDMKTHDIPWCRPLHEIGLAGRLQDIPDDNRPFHVRRSVITALFTLLLAIVSSILGLLVARTDVIFNATAGESRKQLTTRLRTAGWRKFFTTKQGIAYHALLNGLSRIMIGGVIIGAGCVGIVFM